MRKMKWHPQLVVDYLDYVKNSEPSLVHHLGCCLAVASAVAGGACWVQYGAVKRVLMNLYVGLIAPSGYRKSEAIGMAMRVYDMARAKWPLLVPEALPDALSNVGLLQRAQDKLMTARLDGEEMSWTPMFVCSSEFASFLRSRDRDMIAMLTSLFDGAVVGSSFEYQTQTGGTFRIISPYAVLLMASTPEWLSDRLPKAAKQGGFMNRFLFFFSDEYKPRAFPQSEPDIAEKMERVVEGIGEVAKMVGPVGWHGQAMEWFREWYEEKALEELEEPENQDVRGWISRRAIFLIKLAGLSSLMDGRKTITEGDLEWAKGVLELAERGVRLTFRLSGGNQDAWLERELVKFIVEMAAKNGGNGVGVPVSKVCIQFAAEASAKKIREVVESLWRLGVLNYHPGADRVAPRLPQAKEFIRTS